ncbi:MAG: MFS transporter [Rhodospirillales bacterium]|nr:MFS transporter [Rhodospirillales bacterium]
MTRRNEDAVSALAWAIWGLGALYYFYGFFHRVTPSVMVSELMRDFGVGGALLGNLTAVYFYAYASPQFLVGLLLDRFGTRWLLASACALAALGSLIFASATTLNLAYLGRLLIGLGAAFSWIGTLKLIADWMPARRFALLSGCTLFVGLSGAILGQAPLAALVEAAGWRITMVGAAIFGLCLAATMALVIRPHGHAPAVSAARIRLGESFRLVTTTAQTWAVAIYGAAITGPILAFAGLWGVPYMMAAHGLDRPDAATITTTMLIGWGIGGPTVGWLSDRIGLRRPLLLAGSTLAVLCLAIAIYAPSLPLAAVYALLFVSGFASGTMALTFAIAREHNSPLASGAAIGLVNTACMGAAAVLQPVLGLVLDLNWVGETVGGARLYSVEAYHIAFLFLIGWLAFGVVGALLVRETRCQNVYQATV